MRRSWSFWGWFWVVWLDIEVNRPVVQIYPSALGSGPANLFVSIGACKSVSIWFSNFRDEGVELFPVVEGKGFVVVIVFPRALLIPLDLSVVPISKLASYLGFFVKIDFKVGSVER